MEHICGNVYMGVILYKIMISELFFKLKKVRKNVIFRHFYHSPPLQRPREISQNVSGLHYARRGAGYKIHISAKLYYLGRAKVFSSVATDFGSWTSLSYTAVNVVIGGLNNNVLCLVNLTKREKNLLAE